MSAKSRVFLASLCVAACLVTVPVPQAMASGISVSEKSSGIVPMMEYIAGADYDFSVSNGQAMMYATVNGYASLATKCEITIELQEQKLLFWNTVKTWNTVEYGRRAELEVTRSVTSGKSYRMVTTVTVWSGTESETQTMTSGTLEA